MKELQSTPPASAGGVSGLTPAQSKMAALGILPALIHEDVAAAMCAMSAKRFRGECPLPGAQVGKRRLWPRREVERWARDYWRKETGFDAGEAGEATVDPERWANRLPDLPKTTKHRPLRGYSCKS